MDDIKDGLDRMAVLHHEKTLMQIKKQELIDQVITPEIKTSLAEIDSEFEPLENEIDSRIASLEAWIKEMTLFNGKTVKGKEMQAVYTKGRISWDASILDKIAEYEPEVILARKEGLPSISVRFNR